VVEGRGRLGLPLEPLQGVRLPGQLFRQELQGDGALEAEVFGFINDAHAAAANQILSRS
jgi:hypothetical protein